jgi:hypothetical protein
MTRPERTQTETACQEDVTDYGPDISPEYTYTHLEDPEVALVIMKTLEELTW